MRRMRILLAAGLCAATLGGCMQTTAPSAGTTTSTPQASAGSKVSVCVTINALKEFAEAVAGGNAEVFSLIPDGMEPHDFEPKGQDLAKLGGAQVFIYNGLGMERWASDAVKASGNTKLISVEASKGVTPITNDDPREAEEHGQYDPHVWLSLKDAQIQVKNIAAALGQADPANSAKYTKNADDYTAKLAALHAEYADKLGSLSKKGFVTGHAAFAYLCRDFGLEQRSVEDVFAEGEPTAAQLTELTEYCRKNAVRVIFAEEMASPAVSETLANEVGAKVETIYTMESAEEGKSYLDRARENLDEIYESLK